MSSKKILVVEDEPDISELIRFNLSLEGYLVESVFSAESAWDQLSSNSPDLILLDWMLPGMSGLEFCQKLRKHPNFQKIPIVMLTAKNQETDLVIGLEAGADDFVNKPFSPQVLLARISSVLRRSNQEPSKAPLVEIHGIEIDSTKHEVRVKGEELKLTQSEFQILQFLCRKPGWVFTRNQIVDAIRGENYAVTERAIDFQMVGLRKKLGDLGSYIETIRGVGYRLKEQ